MPGWVVGLLVLVVLYAVAVGALVVLGRREDAVALARFGPDCVVLLRRLARDPRVSRRQRWLLLAAVGYLVVPVDLVPDFLPVVGQLDDALVVALVLRGVVRAAGPEVVRERWPGPPAGLGVIERLAR